MQKTDTAELRRLWEAATKGKWKHFRDEFIKGRIDRVIAVPGQVILRDEDIHRYAWKDDPRVEADWNFIAAAHNALPALLDELDAAREELRELKADYQRLEEIRRDLMERCERMRTMEWLPLDEIAARQITRDRRMKAIGAAEWLEANSERLDTMNRADVEQEAAKLRQEAEDGRND